MRPNPARLFHGLTASYWFVPSCMVLLAVGLAVLMPWLDTTYPVDVSGSLAWIGQTQTDGARAVLGAIAGSIIGVAGTTFSITIVAVSFASSNFGPRLVSNFMRDRGNQVTLGTFIATFVYCLLVLRRVHGAADDGMSASYDAFVPHLSVLFALALALASVGVLIYFIHHVPETIDVDRLVASIGRDLRRAVIEPFPGTPADVPDGAPHAGAAWEKRVAGRTHERVGIGATGYVQAVEIDRLRELADTHGLLVRLRFRPGDFVIDTDEVLDVWLPSGEGAPPNDGLRDCFALGNRRTAHQNPVFLIEQLVEVIGRALSPGTNDPFTAIACFDWLKSALVAFVTRTSGHDGVGTDGPVRVRPIDVENVVSAVFDGTRQYVCADRNVALHVMGVLVEVGTRAVRAGHRDALVRRMDELLAASRAAMSGPEGADDVAMCHADGLRSLADPALRERHRSGEGRLGKRA